MTNKETFWFTIISLVLIGIVIGLNIISSYFEAKAFNDCTGGNATLITAMFTDLRINNCNIK